MIVVPGSILGLLPGIPSVVGLTFLIIGVGLLTFTFVAFGFARALLFGFTFTRLTKRRVLHTLVLHCLVDNGLNTGHGCEELGWVLGKGP